MAINMKVTIGDGLSCCCPRRDISKVQELRICDVLAQHNNVVS